MTARLVVNSETFTGAPSSPWAWLLPTVVGSVVLAWLQREVARGRRPRF